MANVGFYVAHAGEETHTFGAAIRNHIENGHNVSVVLMTDGRGSKARPILNGFYDASWHKGEHDLPSEGASGTHYRLFPQQFADLRTEEFVQACLALGVPRENIYENESMRMEDNFLGPEDASTMMEDYGYAIDRWKTHSEFDSNADKRRAAIGARESSEGTYGIGSDLRFYADPEEAASSPANIGEETCVDEQKVIDAVNVYKQYDPANGKFAIGYHDAPSKFDAVVANVKSYYHR